MLRGRPGYRELLRIYAELLGRTRLDGPNDLQPLLEPRDAALIYEYWCYFMLVHAAAAVLGRPAELSRFNATFAGTYVPYGYRADWPEASIIYNATYPAGATASSERRHRSYSVPLRTGLRSWRNFPFPTSRA